MSDVLVVGAGMAGLVAATTLRSTGHSVTVVDKGRGVGGRTATRRFGGATFDHGAQFFTTKTPEGAALADSWASHGAVTTWHTRLLRGDGASQEDGHLRRRGSPTMTGPAKYLAGQLDDVRTGVRLDSVRVEGATWRAEGPDGEPILADGLVMTPPVPQALELLAGVALADDAGEILGGLAYERCIAVLAITAGPTAVPEPGAVRPSDGPVEWLADNQRKGLSEIPCVTIHLRPAPSLEWWDLADDEVVRRSVEAVERWIGAEIVESQVQRWRYARPVEVHPERTLVVSERPPGVMAGDVFGGPLVEGAMLSGRAAAGRLDDLLAG